MPKNVKDDKSTDTSGAADTKTHSVPSTPAPAADEKPKSVINTTDTEYADDDTNTVRTRALTDADRKEIKQLAQKSGAVIGEIAAKFDIEPSEVFAIAEGK